MKWQADKPVATQLVNWIKGGHQPPFSCLQHYEAEVGSEAQEETGLEGEIKVLQSIIKIQVPDQGLISCCLSWQVTKVLLEGCLFLGHKPSLVQGMDLRLPLPVDASQAFTQSLLWLPPPQPSFGLLWPVPAPTHLLGADGCSLLVRWEGRQCALQHPLLKEEIRPLFFSLSKTVLELLTAAKSFK